MVELTARVAGAPITWGVCEVPGWGYQLSPERVLAELAAVGLKATELGPLGFLPTQADELVGMLQAYGLGLVGGFVPLVLHDPARQESELKQAEAALAQLRGGGAAVMVLAAATGVEGYEDSITLDDDGWRHLAETVERIEEMAASLGMTVALHPHYGTVVETPGQVERLLEVSEVRLCLDTGHYLVGGGDPVALAKAIPERIVHSHLKDVDAGLAEQVRSRQLSYHQGVKLGMYRPLGEGDVDAGSLVSALEESGYQGWYVLEQDVVLEGEPKPGKGPIEAARRSLHFLHRLAERIPGETGRGGR